MNMRRALGLWGCLVAGMSAYGQDIDHAKWTSLLQKYATPQQRVDYSRLKSDGSASLDSYLDELAKPWPENMDDDATKAALIDAYNALTVRWIVSNFPVKSIWRTKDPFRIARHKIDGRSESLDSIETRLRNMGDPRIHSALVCAARSCPPLRREAYTKVALNDQLDDNFRMWLADPSRNQFLPNRKVAKVSQIFKWYAGDFAKVGGVPVFLEKYAPSNSFAIPNKLEYQSYNWGLNDSGSLGDSYSAFEFYIDYARNGYLRSDVGGWFFGLGKNYGVDPVIFGTIYVGAIPFFLLSIAWLVRNLRGGRPAVVPLLSAAFFFVSAYLYLIIAGKNIPVWVYVFVVGMLAYGTWSTVRKVRTQVGKKQAA